jgi:histidinol-phosphate aminotransferase
MIFSLMAGPHFNDETFIIAGRGSVNQGRLQSCSLILPGVSSVPISREERFMPNRLFNRRDFSRSLGQSLALALATPRHASLLTKIYEPSAGAPIRLNYNENSYGPSPLALEALAISGPVAARYPEQAREQLAAALAYYHHVRPENILLGCGSTEILRVADMAFLQSGQNLVVAEPTFEAVLEYAGVAHAKAVKIPLTADHRHDLPRMAAACTSKTGIVYICNPNNPTGTIVTRVELEDFVSRIPPATLILVDEAYFHFVEDSSYSSAVGWFSKHPNLVVARTFSKIYGLAGMRLGYAVGAKEAIDAMGKQILNDNLNAAVIPAALAALADTAYAASCRDRLNTSRRWLADQLTKGGWRFIPSDANFLMIDAGTDVEPLLAQFEARGIIVGRRFASLNCFLRVTIGTQDEMESFFAVFKEVLPHQASKAT